MSYDKRYSEEKLRNNIVAKLKATGQYDSLQAGDLDRIVHYKMPEVKGPYQRSEVQKRIIISKKVVIKGSDTIEVVINYDMRGWKPIENKAIRYNGQVYKLTYKKRGWMNDDFARNLLTVVLIYKK